MIRYLKSIMNYEIIYEMIDELKGYTNVDWVSDQETRRFFEVYVFLLYDGAISWTFKR